MNKLKLCLAALGFSAALLAAGTAAAGVTWSYPTTLFEDDDIDFLWTVDDQNGLIPDADGIINEGDILIAVFEMEFAGGNTIMPDELTGVVALEIATITPPSLAGNVNMFFKPYAGGMNAILALGSANKTVTGGGAGGGAMLAMWLDSDPDLVISADNVDAGTVSCDSLSTCIDQAVDGNLFEVDGFAGDPDEIWAAFSVRQNTADVLGSSTGSVLGFANASVSILDNQTGRLLDYNALPCTLCGTGIGADGFADVIGSGTINGGGRDGVATGLSDGLVADGAFATSDFQIVKKPIPEPGTLALLAAGILGMGAAQRWRRKAKRV